MRIKSNIAALIVLLGVFCAAVAGAGAAGPVFSGPFNYDLQGLVWSGDNVVFMLAPGQLYRSTDEGQTWKNQAANMSESTVHSTINYIFQDIVDDTKLIFVADTGLVGWTTADAGATYQYTPLNPSATPITDLIFHPSVSGLIATKNCASAVARYCDYYVSQNFAATFQKMGTYHNGAFSWGAENTPSTSKAFYVVDKDLNFGYTPDFGATWVTLIPLGYTFLFTSPHLFVGTIDNQGDTVIRVSSGPFTDASSFVKAEFPTGDDIPAFVFLDDSSGAEWVGVWIASNDNTNKANMAWGNIIVSDVTGSQYVDSIDHIHRDQSEFDFDIFHGLMGIYIANVLTNYGQQKTTPLIVTRITFNNGGDWQSLKPPAKDANGVDIICTGTCSLHLHGITSYNGNFGPFYSTDNAVGLLLATGNIGTALSFDTTQTNTYFSRDAGVTWVELLKGPYIYEFGDHGGILILSSISGPTTQIWYSLDEGLTLRSASLGTTSPVSVENIIAEPSATSQRFILYGTMNQNNIVMGIDFSGLQQRTCADSDYEKWTPVGIVGTCHLGRNTTYSRRIRGAQCFNNRDKEHVESMVNCKCTAEDYECDYGYQAQMVNGEYVCSQTGNPVDIPKDCVPGQMYPRSKGYRKVAGDSCEGDLEKYEPTYEACPNTGKKADDNGSHTTATVVIVLVVFGVLGVIAFVVYRNERWREKVLSAVGIRSGPSRYSRLGGALADEEFGIGGEHDIDDDDDVEEDAPVLQDNDIAQATSTNRDNRDEFDPRS